MHAACKARSGPIGLTKSGLQPSTMIFHLDIQKQLKKTIRERIRAISTTWLNGSRMQHASTAPTTLAPFNQGQQHLLPSFVAPFWCWLESMRFTPKGASFRLFTGCKEHRANVAETKWKHMIILLFVALESVHTSCPIAISFKNTESKLPLVLTRLYHVDSKPHVGITAWFEDRDLVLSLLVAKAVPTFAWRLFACQCRSAKGYFKLINQQKIILHISSRFEESLCCILHTSTFVEYERIVWRCTWTKTMKSAASVRAAQFTSKS